MQKLTTANMPQAQSGVEYSKGNYYDLNGLNQLRAADPNDQQALRTAAKQFESIFTQMLLSSMRKASDVLEADSPFNSQSTKFYRDMQDKQMVSDLADSGGLGLTDLIVEQLSGLNPNFKPASVVRPDAQLNGLGRVYSHLPAQQLPPSSSPSSSSSHPHTASETPESITAGKSQLFDSPQSFVRSLLPVAKQAVEGTPLQPLFLVAQAALETGWGKNVINKQDGSSSFNLFGVKADNSWQGEKATVQTVEFRDGVARKERANFRAYGSLEESIKDYAQFVTKSPRYSQAVQQADNASQYFEQLQQAGYATDPQYATKILSILHGKYLNTAQ